MPDMRWVGCSGAAAGAWPAGPELLGHVGRKAAAAVGDAGPYMPQAKSFLELLHSTSALDARSSGSRLEIHPLKCILSFVVS